MDTLTKIIKLMNEKDCDNQMLASELGLNRQVVTDWKAKRSKSYTKYIYQIADYFGVSVDYLLGNENAPQKATILIPKSNEALTEHEQVVIKAYRDQPAMQPAVDKLLGVEQDGEVTVYAAAHSVDKRPDGIISIPKDQWKKIEDAPDTDDPLV